MSIDFAVENGVATVTLNRPEALNALSGEMRSDLQAAWSRIAEDEEIHVAVVTGTGRAFCTGSDLKKSAIPMAESHAIQCFGGPDNDRLLTGIEMDKPLIAAINGYAVGGGLELALACDVRIASDNAQMGLSEVRVGSIPGAGGTQRLPRAVGSAAAMYMLLTGTRVSAEEARAFGLVSEVTTQDGLLERAAEIAQRVRANAPLAVRAVKRLVREGMEMPLAHGIERERYVWGLLRDTHDRAEGRKAFAEKRTPQFEGR